MFKKKKSVEDSRSRYEIITDNITKYMDLANLTQGQIAEKLNLTRASVSKKMKSSGSRFSIEELQDLSLIFNVSIEDLFLNEQERAISRIKNNNYKPLGAKKIETFRLLKPVFRRPFKIMMVPLLLFLLSIAVIILTIKESPYWCLLLLGCFPVVAFLDYFFMFEKQSYSINYLDNIYYMIGKEKFHNYKYVLILHIIESIILVVSCIRAFFILGVIKQNDSFNVFQIYAGAIIMFAAINILSLINLNCKTFKKKIYDNDINTYSYNFANFIINLMNVICTLQLFLTSNNYGVMFFVGGIISFVSSIVEFILISKKFSEYDLYYEEYDTQMKKLYQKDFFD